jgi:MOSC domain-containing protein YiiM
VIRVVQRLPDAARSSPQSGRLEPGRGLLGDRWASAEAPHPEAEVTMMRVDVAALLSDGADYALLGDNLFVALDTSAEHLPAGTRLRVGGALCEVTAKPHTGCRKFAVRVGAAALALTGSPAGRAANLRGVHLRVLLPGDVHVGDAIRVEAST